MNPGDVSWLQLASKLPAWSWNLLGRWGSPIVVRRQIRGVRQWKLNYEVIHGRPPTTKQQVSAVESWIRNTGESLTLGRLTSDQVIAQVVIEDDELAKYQNAATRGAVLALPHLGNWDLAGAWSSAVGLPVSSVAERLAPRDFQFFLELRAKLGMKIYAHDDLQVMDKLRADLDAGRVVALLADRDFSRHGVPVNWTTVTGSVELTMPPGPAALASSTNSVLLPTVTYFDDDKLRIEFGNAIDPQTPVAQATQQLADYFSTHVREHTVDWHLFQRFFPGVVV